MPDDVLEHYRAAGTRGRTEREAWAQRSAAFHHSEPELAAQLDACYEQRGLAGWESKLPAWKAGEDALATRQACTAIVNAVLDVVPGLLCGGADLTENTGMELKDAPVIDVHRFGGRQLHYGVREHGMGSVMNGMAVSYLMPAGGTFFVFSDYMRGAVRLAALSGYKTLFVWTHDSVGLGEDGPTHQPIEQLAAMRAMPGLRVLRPADANETSQACRIHVDDEGPTALVLTRQKLPVLAGTAERAPAGVPRGAYTLVDETGDGLDLVLLGHRLGGLGVRRGARAPRRPLGAGGVDAVVGPLRRAIRRLPGAGAPGRRADTRRRGRSHLRVGALRRRRRGYRPLRRLGTRPVGLGEVRVHRRERRRACPRAARERRKNMSESAIARLNDFGQSPWYDNLARPLLTGGGLQQLVDDDGIRGVTSNPTILDKAIGAGDGYDEQLADCARRGLSIEDTYWEVVLADIVSAADLLRPVYDAQGGGDGFVSVEVAPTLAHDTDGTIAAARSLFAAGRPAQRDDQDPRRRSKASVPSRNRSPPASTSTSRSSSRSTATTR